MSSLITLTVLAALPLVLLLAHNVPRRVPVPVRVRNRHRS